MRAYRGIPIGKTEFVYGSYCEVDQDRAFIISPQASCEQNFGGDYVITGAIEVIPETVGQSIGKHDSKRTKEYPEGQEIYEGDEVEYFVRKTRRTGLISWGAVRFWIVGVGNKLQWIEHWKIAVIGDIHHKEQK